MSSKPDERNLFLRLLVSNCILDNKKARISLFEPFNLLLKNPSYPMWSATTSKPTTPDTVVSNFLFLELTIALKS